VILRAPTREECQLVRVWRNEPDVAPMLRTGAKTEAEQDVFFRDIVSRSDSGHRYYALEHDGTFIGLGGLTYLNDPHGSPLTNQITLVIGAPFRQRGLGTKAVNALLIEAFTWLRLPYVQGECFAAGPVWFWRLCVARLPYKAWHTLEPNGTFRWRWEMK
jgi:RimJ/RimL family protein N-acetyltransferase